MNCLCCAFRCFSIGVPELFFFLLWTIWSGCAAMVWIDLLMCYTGFSTIYWSVPIIFWSVPTIFWSHSIDFWVVPIIYWYFPIGYQYNWINKYCRSATLSFCQLQSIENHIEKLNNLHDSRLIFVLNKDMLYYILPRFLPQDVRFIQNVKRFWLKLFEWSEWVVTIGSTDRTCINREHFLSLFITRFVTERSVLPFSPHEYQNLLTISR